jgi:beta-lactamase class A
MTPGCAGAQRAGSSPTRTQGLAAAADLGRRADTVALRRTLDSLAAAHHGVVGYSVRNLETGEYLSARGDEPFTSASVIKVPILVTLYDFVEQGRISLDDPLTMLQIDQVGGSGILQFMRAPMTLTVGDAAALMIILSDNTATNLLLDRIVIRRVWEKMEALGLPRSKVHSKTFSRISSVAIDSSAKYGFGVTTPNEMTALFALLAQGKAVSPKADSAMLALLERNPYDRKLLRFASGVRAAHKSGELSDAHHDCALFRLPARVAACVMTRENADQSWRIDNEALVTIARMGEAVVRAWSPAKAAAASP